MIVLYINTNALNIRYTVISNQLVVTAVMEVRNVTEFYSGQNTIVDFAVITF